MRPAPEQWRQIKQQLNDSRYAGSKDWRHSDYADRVEWLIAAYESKVAENEMWVEQIIKLSEKLKCKKNDIT